MLQVSKRTEPNSDETHYLVAADAGFYSAKNEAAAKAKGVKRVCVPNRSTKSKKRRREQSSPVAPPD
jgi:IS5 family transposase